MASIVEREGLNADQRAHVASVFYNRLAGKLDGLRYLNSDATMMYVTGGEVTADDLQSDSPYNTYKHEGSAAHAHLLSVARGTQGHA